ncbi:MAG TPA: HD domain-containing phosphohydrolase [Bryobacteraceae bacterium]|nr:HD domain-containing phosphohydrolase [Bryobacteraceae bacterium]
MASNQSQTRREYAAQWHVFLHIALGSAALVAGLGIGHWNDPLRFASFVVAAALGSTLKVKLPGQNGTASVSSLFVLISLVNLSVSETLVVGAISVIVQCLWRPKKRPRAIQIAFSVCVLAIAVNITSFVYSFTRSHLPELVALAVLPVVYFCLNIFPIAAVIALTENKHVLRVWATFRWTLAYYVIGASMAWVIGTLPHAIQWEFPIICLPLVYLVHRSNRTHLAQMEQERSHMQALNDLHLRTIEALALAIDAKDHTTHDHLQRVQLYAIEIGKDLGLSEQELEALTAAAVLHDIGKLAVPESIISKPGKLTRSEFEKMKIHPVVGAEILERVAFPYPVVPIVRSHHEKWDGSGYPYGLKGNDIPIGARILSAVDCLDALASDRQYRKALPLDDAMARVASEAGTAFDPSVVHALQARYRELEARAKAMNAAPQPMLSVDIKITRGEAPAAGFEAESPAPSALNPVAQARAKQRKSEEASRTMPATGLCSLYWEEALAVAAIRIQRLIEYHAIAFFACYDNLVEAKFAAGDDRAGLEGLAVPRGEGLVGWVADVGKPILNGNPAVEPGYDPRREPRDAAGNSPGLASAMALPLVNSGQIVGVIALYRRSKDAFAADDLVLLSEICPALAALMMETTAPSNDLLEMATAIQQNSADLARV